MNGGEKNVERRCREVAPAIWSSDAPKYSINCTAVSTIIFLITWTNIHINSEKGRDNLTAVVKIKAEAKAFLKSVTTLKNPKKEGKKYFKIKYWINRAIIYLTGNVTDLIRSKNIFNSTDKRHGLFSVPCKDLSRSWLWLGLYDVVFSSDVAALCSTFSLYFPPSVPVV